MTLNWFTSVADSREEYVAARGHRDVRYSRQILECANEYRRTTPSQLQACEAGCRIGSEGRAQEAGGAARADSRAIEQNRRERSDLWSLGLSGDFPLVLLHLTHEDSVDLVRELVRAQAFWRAHGIETDLVIVAPTAGDHGRLPLESISQTVGSGPSADRLDRPGSIFLPDNAQVDHCAHTLLQAHPER